MRARTRAPLCIEALEPRYALSTYYVATTGSNTAAGGENTPWRTLQHAADHVVAGDTVIVRAGNYTGFYLDTDGTSTQRITFQADAGVVIDTRNATTNDGINLEGADFVTIDGFTVNGIGRAGIRTVLNEHVIIRNNTCDQNGVWGIFSGHSYDLLIENNETSRSVAEHGIYVSNSGDRPIIRNNTIWGNHANGIHMNGDESQGGDGIISDALVEGNIIFDNGLGGGSGINCDGVQDSIFQNNLLYNNHASGISLYRIDGGAGSSNNLIVNNTIVQASNARWAINIKNGSTGATVFNNILYNHHSFRGSINVLADSLDGFTSDYNVVMARFSTNDGDSILDLQEWQNATSQDLHSIIATPAELFVDPDQDDYHLKSSSPALNAGTFTLAPDEDIEGRARPDGAAVDIGAYEFDDPGPDADPPPVATVGLEVDPWTAGVQALVVRGTDAAENIRFLAGSGQVIVTIDGVEKGRFATSSVSRLVAYGLGGNDRIEVASALTLRAQLIGGDGDDTLLGGGGNDLLQGDAGADVLSALAGKDVLLGGVGADELRGGNGSDLLIAGTTSHDDTDTSLAAFMAEWSSTRTYKLRTQRLAAGTNGLPKLDATTVFDDAVSDIVFGGKNDDWLFAFLPSDQTDRSSGERLR